MKPRKFFVGLVALLFLIPITVTVGLAAVDVACFAGDFLRSTGKPVTKTEYFFGIAGPAVISLVNNGVSSAIVSVNNTTVFSPSDFNSRVCQRSAVVNLNEGQNVLAVTLKSKPGSSIKINITRSVPAEAAAWVGQTGGLITVEDTSSPLHNLEIKIPAGRVADNTFFSATLSKSAPTPPDADLNATPVINITASNSLAGPVFVTYPIITPITETDSFSALSYNEDTAEWEYMDIIGVDPDNNTVTAVATHFSPSVVQRNRDLSEYIRNPQTNFRYNRDRFHPNALNNDPDNAICKGFTQYALWYYYRKLADPVNDNFGLSCRWGEETARTVADEAYNILQKSISAINAERARHRDAAFSLDGTTIKRLLDGINSGYPQSLALGLWTDDGIGTVWHNILVYDYRKISDTKTEFICYDPNRRVPQILIAEKQTFFWKLSYESYTMFATMNLTPFVDAEFEDIYNAHPDEHWCEDADNDGVYENGDGNDLESAFCQDGNLYSCDDNCEEYNPDQADADGDGYGNVCDEPGETYTVWISVDQQGDCSPCLGSVTPSGAVTINRGENLTIAIDQGTCPGGVSSGIDELNYWPVIDSWSYGTVFYQVLSVPYDLHINIFLHNCPIVYPNTKN